MSSIFTRVVKGEIPSYKIAEDDKYYAFLDINPLAIGHTLVIPKQEVNYIFDVEDELYQGLWSFAKEVARKIEGKIPCERVGIAVIGLEVPHAHIHLIPINKVDDINFSRPKLQLTGSELDEIAERINS